MRTRITAALVVSACSSHATKPPHDEPRPAAVEPPEPAAGGGDAAAAGKGDVQIRVEWKDVPLAARASPGRTACGTARAGAVAPSTLWGIPDAFVAIDPSGPTGPTALPASASSAMPAADARIVLDRCAFVPRAIAAGTTIAVTTTAEAPQQLAIAKRGTLADPSQLEPGARLAIQLPLAGHTVVVPLERGAIYELTGAADPAWIVAAPCLVTDAAGQAVLRDVPSGKHALLAWLPPRADQPGRIARGDVQVTAGALVEVTLDLAK